jgi:predicted membrane-bound mannosyltransferase
MLTIFVKRKSSSIPTKEACPPVITAASPVTSNPNVHNKSYKSYTRSYTFDGSSGSTALVEVCSCQSEWQTKEEQIKALQEKAVKAQWQP